MVFKETCITIRRSTWGRGPVDTLPLFTSSVWFVFSGAFRDTSLSGSFYVRYRHSNDSRYLMEVSDIRWD